MFSHRASNSTNRDSSAACAGGIIRRPRSFTACMKFLLSFGKGPGVAHGGSDIDGQAFPASWHQGETRINEAFGVFDPGCSPRLGNANGGTALNAEPTRACRGCPCQRLFHRIAPGTGIMSWYAYRDRIETIDSTKGRLARHESSRHDAVCSGGGAD